MICISTRICAWIWVFQVPSSLYDTFTFFVESRWFCQKDWFRPKTVFLRWQKWLGNIFSQRYFVPVDILSHFLPGDIFCHLDMGIPGPSFGHILSMRTNLLACCPSSCWPDQTRPVQTWFDPNLFKSVRKHSFVRFCTVIKDIKMRSYTKNQPIFWAKFEQTHFLCFYIYKINRPKGPKYPLNPTSGGLKYPPQVPVELKTCSTICGTTVQAILDQKFWPGLPRMRLEQ